MFLLHFVVVVVDLFPDLLNQRVDIAKIKSTFVCNRFKDITGN